MTDTHRNRKSRAVEVRFTEEQKETIGRAATLLDLPLSDFITASAIQAAEAAIREHPKIKQIGATHMSNAQKKVVVVTTTIAPPGDTHGANPQPRSAPLPKPDQAVQGTQTEKK